MNEIKKDKGLEKAIRKQPKPSLSSNFTFRTMQKIEEAALLREKRTERLTFAATVAASVFLAACGIVCLSLYCGDMVRKYASAAGKPGISDIPGLSFYALFLIAFILCLLFDNLMRKLYFKRHAG